MNIEFVKESMKKNANTIAVITNSKEYLFNDIYLEYEKSILLLKERNIKRNSVVALIAEFTPKSIALFLALMEYNCIIVPISKTIKKIDEYVAISESEYLISLNEETIIIKETSNIVKHNMLLGLKEKNVSGLILFSSGTTGQPKAAVHDMSYLLEKFKTNGKVFKTITFLLFDHIGGFNTMMYALVNGGTIVTVATRTTEEVCSLIERYKVELLPTSPTFINMILLNKSYEKFDLSSLKVISYGTEPMPEYTLKQIHRLLPNIKLKQTYGLSEVGIMATKSEDSDSLWMKIGGEGFETKIVDDILYIKSKSAMLGYLNAPSPFDNEGWFNTKDKVEIKGEFVKILGRISDIINVGGEKVYPNEIESVLLENEDILDVHVFGEDNPIVGKTVVAEIKVEAINNNREFIKCIRRYCCEKLEKFKRPTKIVLTEENLYGDRLKKKR